MNFFDKMEQKLGRYAIRNLMLYLMIFYLAGLVLNLAAPGVYEEWLALDMERIFQGEIWRLLTYLICPPSDSILWCLLICYLYYSLGQALERMWGTFYLNLYVGIGLLANVAAALVIYLCFDGLVYPITPDSLYLSMLLAFAVTVPETRFYIFWVIPIKAKYLAILYGAVIVLELIFLPDWPVKVAILASVANFLLFFLVIRRPLLRVKQAARLRQFQQRIKEAAPRAHRHHCAVCGRTELDSPDLEFRYCSKCAGGLEFCMDHLYTHIHVKEGEKPDFTEAFRAAQGSESSAASAGQEEDSVMDAHWEQRN